MADDTMRDEASGAGHDTEGWTGRAKSPRVPILTTAFP